MLRNIKHVALGQRKLGAVADNLGLSLAHQGKKVHITAHSFVGIAGHAAMILIKFETS